MFHHDTNLNGKFFVNGCCMVAIMLLQHFHWIPVVYTPIGQVVWLLVGVLTALVMLWSYGDEYREAIIALKRFEMRMPALMLLSTGAAWVLSMLICINPLWFPLLSANLYFSTVFMVLMVYFLSAILKSSGQKEMVGYKDPAQLFEENYQLVCAEEKKQEREKVKRKAPSALQHNDEIVVPLRALVPCDGFLLSKQAFFSKKWITGDDTSCELKKGAPVFSGYEVSEAHTGTISIRVEKTAKNSLFQKSYLENRRPIEVSQDAWEGKATRYWVPFVFVLSIVSVLIGCGLGMVIQGVFAAFSLLLVACPCAFILGPSLSIKAGVWHARKHTFFQNPSQWFKMAAAVWGSSQKVSVASDFHGTCVQKTEVDKDNYFENADSYAVLKLASGLNHKLPRSSPYGRAIDAYLADQKASDEHYNLDDKAVVDGGTGVRGTLTNGTQVFLGNEAFLKANGLSISEPKEEGVRVSHLFIGEVKQATFRFKDAVTLGLGQVNQLKALRRNDGQVIVVSGSTLSSGDKSLLSDFPCYEHCPAASVVEEKQDQSDQILGKKERVQELQKEGGVVIGIGDDRNDEAMLNQSNVPIVVGLGAGLALPYSAHIYASNPLKHAKELMDLSLAVQTNVHQNIAIAMVFSLLNIVGMLVGYGTGLFTFGPMYCALLSLVPALLVMANAYRFKHKETPFNGRFALKVFAGVAVSVGIVLLFAYQLLPLILMHVLFFVASGIGVLHLNRDNQATCCHHAADEVIRVTDQEVRADALSDTGAGVPFVNGRIDNKAQPCCQYVV